MARSSHRWSERHSNARCAEPASTTAADHLVDAATQPDRCRTSSLETDESAPTTAGARRRDCATITVMSRDLRVEDLPDDFDDSDDPEGEVHAVARRVFMGATNVEVFAKVQHWLSLYEVLLIDLSCDYLYDEPAPVCVTLYFRFKDADET